MFSTVLVTLVLIKQEFPWLCYAKVTSSSTCQMSPGWSFREKPVSRLCHYIQYCTRSQCQCLHTHLLLEQVLAAVCLHIQGEISQLLSWVQVSFNLYLYTIFGNAMFMFRYSPDYRFSVLLVWSYNAAFFKESTSIWPFCVFIGISHDFVAYCWLNLLIKSKLQARSRERNS